ncbi:MAG: hypothetical protein JWN66_4834 [Sphingomonas bacterium]|uniref:hypothetical protein n=1 Tax=Sphingomonas bacterium TaxID=1895847 RepID=UPI002634BF75|nr:hypothetical protein [Sphingomonas bacterium]MDB5707718.1 hypothetical protein [Sphingomonas bacterium]
MIGLMMMLAAANTPLDDAQRDYNICVRKAAVRLEPSGDAPEDIARAAQVLCSTERFVALNIAVKAGGTAVNDTESAAKFYAAAEVTIARLCRKTKDCINTGLK